jgi:hypothetical protein
MSLRLGALEPARAAESDFYRDSGSRVKFNFKVRRLFAPKKTVSLPIAVSDCYKITLRTRCCTLSRSLMRYVWQSLIVMIICLCLASCFLPENFTATLTIDKTEHFSFIYDGTIAFGPALAEISQRGALSPEAEKQMKDGESSLRQSAGCQRLNYIGAGRFKIHFESSGSVGNETPVFVDVITLRRNDKGQILMNDPTWSADAFQQLRQVGLKLDGRLTVTTELPVVQQNSDQGVKQNGTVSSYNWHLTLEQREPPLLVLQTSSTYSGLPNSVLQSQNFTRLLIGKWQGGRHLTEYFADGTFILDPDPDSPPRGQWRVEGDKLFKSFSEGGTDVYIIISINETELVIQSRDGKQYTLTKQTLEPTQSPPLAHPPSPLRMTPSEQFAAAERDLNKAWSDLTLQQKSELRQDERKWITMKDNIPTNDSKRLRIIQQRTEYLKSLLKVHPQRDERYLSPDGQFVLTRTGSVLKGSGQRIVLKTTVGQELLVLAAGGDFGCTCSWAPDSRHLVVVIPNRIAASVIFAQAIREEWRTAASEGIPVSSDEKILDWPSTNIVKMQAGRQTFTFTFAEYETFSFRLSRFGGITLETVPGKERVRIFQGDKGAEETVFESTLAPDGARSYVTPHGTRLMLNRLIKPVVYDANRKINSGEWKLVISGTDEEYVLMKQRIGSPTFGETGRTEYYGDSLLIGVCNQ